VGGAVAQLVLYSSLVWFGIFGHDGGSPPCYGPHRDIFFPPATICTPTGAPAYRATSLMASAAGAVLFVLAACMLVAGLLALLRTRPRPLALRARPAVALPGPVPPEPVLPGPVLPEPVLPAPVLPAPVADEAAT
jgi:hypothetical protein